MTERSSCNLLDTYCMPVTVVGDLHALSSLNNMDTSSPKKNIEWPLKYARQSEEYKSKRQRAYLLSICYLAKTTWTQVTITHHCYVMVCNIGWDTSQEDIIPIVSILGWTEEAILEAQKGLVTTWTHTVWCQLTSTLLSPTEVKICCESDVSIMRSEMFPLPLPFNLQLVGHQ